MSDDNLTQHQQNLKSLRGHLLEICEDHLAAKKYFLESQDQARTMWYRINKSSHDVSDLLVWLDEMIDDEIMNDVMPTLPQSNDGKIIDDVTPTPPQFDDMEL